MIICMELINTYNVAKLSIMEAFPNRGLRHVMIQTYSDTGFTTYFSEHSIKHTNANSCKMIEVTTIYLELYLICRTDSTLFDR